MTLGESVYHLSKIQGDNFYSLDARSSDLKALKRVIPLSENAPAAVIYTPPGVLRMGFILRESESKGERRREGQLGMF